MFQELWREPRICGLIAVVLMPASWVLRSGYPMAAEFVWWLALALALASAVIMLKRKRGGSP
jgi:hypothetical protein